MPHNFEGIAQGETWSVEFLVKDAAGDPDDLTGRNVTFIIRDDISVLARIADTGTSTGGEFQVTAAEGRIVVTVNSDVTAAIGVSADWALWLDENAPTTADAVTWGKIYTAKVAKSDA
jgi:hypothetical protein